MCIRDREGYARFSLLGGVAARTLPGREVYLLTEGEPLYGVIACLPPHVLSAEQREQTIEVKDMYIDLGLDEAQAKARVPLGTPGVFRGNAEVLNGQYICGKALDDKACVATILDAVSKMCIRDRYTAAWTLSSPSAMESRMPGRLRAVSSCACRWSCMSCPLNRSKWNM